MKKLYTTIFIALFALGSTAQCDPTSYDWGSAEYGIDPDAGEGETFNDGTLGIDYEDFIFIKAPNSASDVDESFPPIQIDSLLLASIIFSSGDQEYSLSEMGLTLECNNLGILNDPCSFEGGQLGCAVISGNPIIAGTFDVIVNATVYVFFGQVIDYPFEYDGYTFTVIDPDNINELQVSDWQLLQNVPNPADKSTTITVSTRQAGPATIELLNMLGEVVETRSMNLKIGDNKAGFKTSMLPSGIYFYRLKTNGSQLTKRMIVSH